MMVHPLRTSAFAMMACLLSGGTSQATSYASFHDRDIIQAADLIFDGTVASITTPKPPDKTADAYSIVALRVDKVHKGIAKAGDVIRVIYRSHGDGSLAPVDRYAKDEKGLFALNKIAKKDRDDHDKLAPPGAAPAEWLNRYRYPYHKQVQSAAFRQAVEVSKRPEAYLDDAAQFHNAVFFLAHRKELDAKRLVAWLSTGDRTQKHAACEAVRILRERAALPALVNLATTTKLILEARKAEPNPLEETAGEISALHDDALQTISALPLDLERDGPLVLRLALARSMPEGTLLGLLDGGPARWEVRHSLLEAMLKEPTQEGLAVLHALDARAAYMPLRNLVFGFKKPAEAAGLVNEYSTVWAMRFVLAHGLERRGGAWEEYCYVLRAFGFTHQPIDKGARTGKETWEHLYAELRKSATLQLQRVEDEGHSFARLRERLEQMDQWRALSVGDRGKLVPEDKHKHLIDLIVASADPKAAGLNADAEAAWLVDLHYTSYRHLAMGQLWIAADGTFGFDWLPDRAWGKSVRLAKEVELLAK